MLEKMKKIMYLSLLLSAMAGHAQSFLWLQTPPVSTGFNGDLVGYPIASSSSGSVYACGFKDTPFPYLDVMGNLFFNKYSEEGALLFSKTITGRVSVYAVATDSQDNVVLALSYLNTITMGTTTLTSVSQSVRPLLAKFDPQGNLLWYHELTAVAPQGVEVENFRAIVIDADGNIYAGYDNYWDSYITKYSPSGTALLTIQQQAVKRITSVAIDTDGNIYAAGSCAEAGAIFGGTPMPVNLTYNTYIARYNASGQFAWVRVAEDITCPNPQVVARGPEEVYFASDLFGAMQFGAFQTEGPVQGGSDFFLTKLNSSGNYQWVKEVPGAGSVTLGQRNYLSIDGGGNVYLAGSVSGSVNFGLGVTASGSGFTPDAFVIKYDSAGNPVFAKTATGTSYDRFDGIATSASGNIYLGGMTAGTTSFDNLQYNGGELDYAPVIAKLSNIVLSAGQNPATAVTAYPNPAENLVHITGLPESSAFLIHNVIGQQVASGKLSREGAIDISSLPSGTYYVKLDKASPVKIIKQ